MEGTGRLSESGGERETERVRTEKDRWRGREAEN